MLSDGGSAHWEGYPFDSIRVSVFTRLVEEHRAVDSVDRARFAVAGAHIYEDVENEEGMELASVSSRVSNPAELQLIFIISAAPSIQTIESISGRKGLCIYSQTHNIDA